MSLLQADLNCVTEWCTKWKMVLNASKCKSMRFSRQGVSPPASYSINNASLALVTSYKYLGVHLTSNLSWNQHITYITGNANCMLGYVKRNFSNAPISVKLLLYKTLVHSKLEYAASIWNPQVKLSPSYLFSKLFRTVPLVLSSTTMTAQQVSH